jgi:hypothetical protein
VLEPLPKHHYLQPDRLTVVADVHTASVNAPSFALIDLLSIRAYQDASKISSSQIVPHPLDRQVDERFRLEKNVLRPEW